MLKALQTFCEPPQQAGVRRFIYLSSLGADTGQSAYHQSKLRAEELVKAFGGEWLILRPGNVYGPGDEVISTLFKMVRTLPVVPLVDAGDQRFQPIWFEDLGAAITRAVDDSTLTGQILELAGADVTSTADLIERICDDHRSEAPPKFRFPRGSPRSAPPWRKASADLASPWRP